MPYTRFDNNSLVGREPLTVPLEAQPPLLLEEKGVVLKVKHKIQKVSNYKKTAIRPFF
jgi:hypothetical protein